MKGLKTGGRLPGSTNLVPKPAKELMSNVIGNCYTLESIKKDLEALTSAERLKFLLSALEFEIPKQRFVETVNNGPELIFADLFRH
jgi:hypothetical protein